MIGIRREELADQVAVAGVDLHTVESRLPGKCDGVAEVLDQPLDLVLAQGAGKGRRIKVEAAGGADGGAAAGAAVRHIAAMAELDGRLGALFVDGIRNFPKCGNDLLAHPKLPVKGEAAPVHGGISQRGHPHPTARDGHVVVLQIL